MSAQLPVYHPGPEGDAALRQVAETIAAQRYHGDPAMAGRLLTWLRAESADGRALDPDAIASRWYTQERRLAGR